MTGFVLDRQRVRGGLSDRDVIPGYDQPVAVSSGALTARELGGFRRGDVPGRMMVLAVASHRGPRSRPQWLEPTMRAVADLATLEHDWDSYGAPPIDSVLLVAGASLLLLTMRDNTPPPAVVPTSRGGLAFEWHTRGIDLEIEIVTPSRSRSGQSSSL